MDDLKGCAGAAGGSPEFQVATGDAEKDGIEFDSCHFAKWEFGGEEHRAPHARAHVDEGEFLNGSAGPSSPPTSYQRMKNGWGDAEVRGGVAVVAMAGSKEASRNEAAGVDAVFDVEWVRSESFFFGESWELGFLAG